MTYNRTRAEALIQLSEYKAKKMAEREQKPPIPLDSTETPEIPTKILPDCMAEFVSALSIFTQTPPEVSQSIAIATVSAAIRGKYRVQVRGSYEEPLNEYFITALPPGQLKSPVFNACLAPINEWETNTAERMEKEISKAKSIAVGYDNRIRELQLKMGKATDTERQNLIAEIEILNNEKPEIPVIPSVYTDDVTSEGFIEELNAQCGSLSVFSDEGGLFETIAGRYSGGIPNMDVYLKGHSGSPIKNKRKGKAAIRIMNPAITIGMTVQPDVIVGLGAKPGFRGRGLMARFKYFMPMSKIGNRIVDPPEVPDGISDEWHRMIRAILNTPPPDEREKCYRLHLSRAAHEVRKSLWEMTEDDLRQGKYENMEDWASKMVGSAIRLAGIFHVASYSDDAPWMHEISSDEMERAGKLILLLADHAAIAYGTMGDTPELVCAREVWEWIKEQKKEFIKKRDIQQKFKGKYRTLAQLDPGINLLMEREYLDDMDPDKTRGKTYQVNGLAL